MEGNFEPIPAKLAMELRIMRHDLKALRAQVAAGRVRPEHYGMIERVMASRLELLEAAVQARLLEEAKGGGRAGVRGMN